VGLALAGALLGSAALGAGAGAATLDPIDTAGYAQPTFVTSDPRDPDRLFVTEQPGTIDVTTPTGTSLYLDLTDKVLDGGERGLWSMAFAPDFAQTGLFYVAYSANDGALTLDEYREQASPTATESTRRPVLSIPNNFASPNHNGGQLQFGPDGYLYWSTGEDAAPANAQDTGSLLGKILRIDPRGATPGAYTSPGDNPFVGIPGADEIWAFGLRNPWRFSFDRLTGTMYIADVGAGSWEEVDVGVRGANYGWNICEGHVGPSCFGPGFTGPIYDYASNESPCNAITGGYVVRDPDLGDLYGRYLFSDACVGNLRSIDPAAPFSTGTHRLEGLDAEGPASFGEDACGRLYLAAQGDGRVFRLEGPSGGACPGAVGPDTTPPQTTLKLKRKGKRSPRAKFILRSSEPGSTFRCKFDGGKWKPCGKRRKLRGIDPGKHRFRAKATDPAGNPDPSPARKRFRVSPR
jgi:hypothetical protein